MQSESRLEKVNQAVRVIIETLGRPENDLHNEALAAFHRSEYRTVKQLAAIHLSDHFCRTLAYLGGALELTPNTDSMLVESALAAADLARERTLARLNAEIANILSVELSALESKRNANI